MKGKTVEEQVIELGVTHAYTAILSAMVWGELKTWSDWRDSFALLTAPPEKKRLALSVARFIPDPKPTEAIAEIDPAERAVESENT